MPNSAPTPDSGSEGSDRAVLRKGPGIPGVANPLAPVVTATAPARSEHPALRAGRAGLQMRLRKKQDLYAHLLVFVLVNAVVWTIWALTSTGFPWPALMSAFWGVGLVMNIWEVYGRRPIGEADVQRESERLRGR